MIAFYYDGAVVLKHHSTSNFHQISELTPEEFGIASDAEEGWYTPERELVPFGVDVADSFRAAGGPGSGNFGHAGRPGEVGGSAPSGESLAYPLIVMGGPPISGKEIGDYLVKHGKEWKAAPLPKGVPAGTPQECYANATRLMLDNPEYDYVEGMAYLGGLPEEIGYLHGWVVDKAGNVIDNTWKHPEKNRYFGVKYDRKAYTRHLFKTKVFGVLGGQTRDVVKVLAKGGL